MALLILSSLSFGLPEVVSFETFAAFFNKSYTVEAEARARSVFDANVRKITTHNSDTTKSFRLGVNQFSDLTTDEWKALMFPGGGTIGIDTDNAVPSHFLPPGDSPIDWRMKGAGSYTPQLSRPPAYHIPD